MQELLLVNRADGSDGVSDGRLGVAELGEQVIPELGAEKPRHRPRGLVAKQLYVLPLLPCPRAENDAVIGADHRNGRVC